MKRNCYLLGINSVKQTWYNLIEILWHNSEILVWVTSWTFPLYFNFMQSQFSSVQSLSCVQLLATSWTAARQASLSITNSQSSLTHIHRVSDAIQPSHPLSSPSPLAPNPSQHQSFPTSQLFAWGGQSITVSALASVLPKKSQGWSLSEWTGWITLQSKGLSRVFPNTTVQKHPFFGTQLSSQSKSHIHTWPLEKP